MRMTTMVKAEIDDETNRYIETVQEKEGLNKTEATAYILSNAKDVSKFASNDD